MTPINTVQPNKISDWPKQLTDATNIMTIKQNSGKLIENAE